MAEYVTPDEANAIPGWIKVCVTLAPVSSILMFLSVREVKSNLSVE